MKLRFCQLFCVLVAAPNSGVGCVALMAFLPDKSLLSYQRVFEFLMNNLKIQAPEVLYCDFEAAIIGAANQILGCQMRCCDVHWKRLLRDHVRSCGLQSHYQTDPFFQQWMRKVWTLALLPKDDISEVAEKFVLNAVPKLQVFDGDDESVQLQKRVKNEGMDKLIEYLRRTWFGQFDISTGRVSRRPQYSTDKISKYQAILESERRETNLSESFHSQLVGTLGEKSNMWKVIKGLQSEENNAKVCNV